jgi:Zn-dependent protease with chaperone function
LETPIPFAAQIGFWQSELVISQGLLNQLSSEQIQAVLAHEQAHTYYRDPFWFFWLGWIRQWMAWLPETERLWQELLLLRELRADRWAAEQVDALLVAEALLHMAQVAPSGLESVELENACAAVSANATLTRLEERIEALLAEETQLESQLLLWLWVIPALIPFLTVVLHH